VPTLPSSALPKGAHSARSRTPTGTRAMRVCRFTLRVTCGAEGGDRGANNARGSEGRQRGCGVDSVAAGPSRLPVSASLGCAAYLLPLAAVLVRRVLCHGDDAVCVWGTLLHLALHPLDHRRRGCRRGGRCYRGCGARGRWAWGGRICRGASRGRGEAHTRKVESDTRMGGTRAEQALQRAAEQKLQRDAEQQLQWALASWLPGVVTALTQAAVRQQAATAQERWLRLCAGKRPAQRAPPRGCGAHATRYVLRRRRACPLQGGARGAAAFLHTRDDSWASLH